MYLYICIGETIFEFKQKKYYVFVISATNYNIYFKREKSLGTKASGSI